MMGHMPAIPESTRSSIILRLLDHAEKNWPQLAKVRARYHGSRKPSARPPASSGMAKDGYSQGRTVARSIRTPTTTSGKRCSPRQVYVRLGCTTHGTQPPPC
jgi:hypothetical protein